MKKIFFSLVVFVFVFSSCNTSITFDNVDLNTENTSEFPLFSFDLNQNDFYDTNNNTGIFIVTDTTSFDFFKNDFVKDHLHRFIINYEIDNQFDSEFSIETSFLDQNNNVTRSFQTIIIGARENQIQGSFVFNTSSGSEIFNTSKYAVRITRTPITPVDPNVPESFSFKSTGVSILRFF